MVKRSTKNKTEIKFEDKIKNESIKAFHSEVKKSTKKIKNESNKTVIIKDNSNSSQNAHKE